MKTARLLFDNNADWFYATKVHASDPALWYQAPSGKTHLPTSSRDFTEYKAHAKVDAVHDWDIIRHQIIQSGKPYSMATLLEWLMALEPTDAVEVPQTFPAGLFEALKAAGLPVQVSKGEAFFPQRAVKTLEEIEKLAEAQRHNEQAFHKAAKVLREADIARDGTLMWQGATLTSEILRAEMQKVLVGLGSLSFNNGPYVQGGAQAAIPHERGHGPLRANELILIDCFPTSARGYCGDLTRTFCKGKPTQWHKDVYLAVLGAQEKALGMLRQNANGQDVQKAVEGFFNDAGFATGKDAEGNPYGFIHSLGHSVGLEVHDGGPRMLTRADCPLKSGYVTSVEPGLYYPPGTHKHGTGGCRIEDVVVVTENGYQNLTTFPKDKWIID